MDTSWRPRAFALIFISVAGAGCSSADEPEPSPTADAGPTVWVPGPTLQSSLNPTGSSLPGESRTPPSATPVWIDVCFADQRLFLPRARMRA